MSTATSLKKRLDYLRRIKYKKFKQIVHREIYCIHNLLMVDVNESFYIKLQYVITSAVKLIVDGDRSYLCMYSKHCDVTSMAH